jgi:uncharacterized protein YegL
MTAQVKQLTSLVIDRSGSIQSCLSDMQGGMNTFIAERKSDPIKEKLALASFDDRYELVTDFVKKDKFPAYTISPRGGTALYDAIGRAVAHMDESAINGWANAIKGIVIVTDGYENMSHEHNKESIKALIESKTADGWQFIYLGANQDAVLTAEGFGINPMAAMTFDTNNAPAAMTAASNYFTRGSVGKGYSFNQSERNSSVK